MLHTDGGGGTPLRVHAGIVTFEPDVDILRKNIDAIAPQVERVVIYDNGSANLADITEICQSHDTVELLDGRANVGIATALNAILARVADLGADWVVTLDQDSVSSPEMVSGLATYADPGVGMVTPFIVDRNKMTMTEFALLAQPPVDVFTRAASKGAITSGAMTNVDAVKAVGGFADAFFIDYVDYELNRRLLDAGYAILRANAVPLEHEVGKARRTWLVTPRRMVDGRWRWERFYSFGHSEGRCYYKARNRVLYTRLHWRSTWRVNEGVWQLPQQLLLILLFEESRFAKAREFLRGVGAGLRHRFHASP